ncbi:VWA domain-containing protein [Marinicellulosiphila megalodicopiae]|uniref:VWA domain-containing protein n=1 Tax=Marinicellulosiphila megalodicopiae TaxID=2724896 RepID=UPI003BB10085
MINSLLSIEFAWWWVIVLFPLMPIWYLYVALNSNSELSNQSIHLPFAAELEQLNHNAGANINWLDFIFKLLAWSFLLIALMRPQLPIDAFNTPTTGRDMFLVIDVSQSMKERDMMLNNRRVRRMDAVKLIASDFLRQRTGDRVGLVFFGKHIATQAPLTYDTQTVADFIENVQYGDLDDQSSGTVIGDALATTINKLLDAEIKNKVIILLTDGEDYGSTRPPLEMAEIAQKSNIKIYTIGVSAYNRGVDEITLEKIASMTNGQYFRARNSYELQQIYQAIDQLEPNENLNLQVQPKKEYFFVALSICLLFILLPFIFNLTQRLQNLNQEKK